MYFSYLPSKAESSLSQSQLKNNINNIASKHTNLYARCEIWDKNRFKNNVLTNDMTEKQRIISINGGDGLLKNYQPVQVYGIFESWLFIFNKNLPYEVISIRWGYTSGGMDNTNVQTTIVTKFEFAELYNSTDISNLSNEQAVNKLADKWMEKTLYFKGCHRDNYEQERLFGKSNREKLMLILRDDYYNIEGVFYGKTFVNKVIVLLELNKVEHFLTSDETDLFEPFYELLLEQKQLDNIAYEKYGDTYERYSSSEVKEYDEAKSQLLNTLFNGKSLLESL